MSNIHNINSSQLELLVALVEQGSFSAAAQALGLTQSAVSHGLARLETELGLVLVERGRRGITLTEAGHHLLPHAREITTRLQTIRQIAALASETAHGKLRLGITYPLAPSLITGLISAFREAHPMAEILIVDDVGTDSRNWLADSFVDVGLCIHPAPGADSRLAFNDEFCAILPIAHPLASQQSVSLEELHSYPLLLPRLGREVLQGAFRQRAESIGRPQQRHLLSNREMLLALVREGFGIAIAGRRQIFALDDDSEDLKAVSLSPSLPLPLGFAVRSWESAAPLAKQFVEFAADWFAALGKS
jgi:DNA-binding transcriptional LysR family regulator